ncbi:MAG TPA: OB-fold nucleic acid binding domain-containing protein, partial [Anaerolineales bacterium]|nr:OB-fold nucleic acid binding domain-containing protein [Anaerolineales bacterium]
MARETADGIYTDWEEFARYGFNKSHAADYGVIAVQTAFLKANYTAEYMTALLSASAGITEKVAYYVADARTMGMSVLPPDINASGWDFEIEDINEKPAIRFGLGAIKNVGQGAVEKMIEERKAHGKFKDLNHFARRVDLRSAGKRALECLIKVGALDSFGNRAAQLASLERIVAISSNHFRAAEAGQMSLFGEATGVIEDVHLPDVNNVDKREMLNWERELIGLYISDHPLTPYQQTFAQLVNYFSGQLGEAQHEEKVRLAGLITSVRPYMTKANKPMGFVTVEDIQGNIELVLFPRTWEKYRETLAVGQIVIVDGKVDAQSTPPKILVDAIRTEIKVIEAADAPLPNTKPAQTPAKTAPVSKTAPRPTPQPVKPALTPARQAAETTATYIAKPTSPPTPLLNGEGRKSDGGSEMPPPPDNFPAGWDDEWQPSFDEAAIAAKTEPIGRTISPTYEPRDVVETPKVEPETQDTEPVTAPLEALNVALRPPSALPPFSEKMGGEGGELEPQLPPSLYVPLAKEEKDPERAPKQITVLLRSTGDKERDKRRIKTIYGT